MRGPLLGRGQIGVCQRSGIKMRRRLMVEDGQVKGLLVHPDWWEPYHPQLMPPPMRPDGLPRRRPAPDDSSATTAPVTSISKAYAGITALMHFDGTQGSTTFTDSGPNGATFSVDAGTPTISTAQSKFGGASIAFNTTTTPANTDIISAANQAAFDVVTADFTVEAWVYIHSYNAGSCVLGLGAALATPFANPRAAFGVNASGNPQFDYFDASSNHYGANFIDLNVPLNTWTSLAWVRHNNVLKCYMNGVASGTTVGSLPTSPDPALKYAAIGGGIRVTNLYNGGFMGWIDELRISNLAQYTANYTPATQAFSVGITLTWTPSSNNETLMEQYNVYRSTNNGTTFLLLGTVPVTQAITIENDVDGSWQQTFTYAQPFADPAAVAGYQYYVQAIPYYGGQPANSNTVTA